MHEKFMQLALSMAEKGIYHTKPNPAVGCVIVKNNQVLATGYHAAYGQSHAEISALEKLNFDAKACDMYITLEPCAHHGNTPPCVDSIIKSGIKRVIIPFTDPNPLTAGKSIDKLKAHGIKVITGVLAANAYEINRFFLHYMKTQKPYIIAKWAMTNTGQLTNSDNTWISHPQSREHTHLLRQRADAILIGANTLRADNPQLTTRAEQIKPAERKHPLRIILTRYGEFSFEQRLFNDAHAHNTLIACMNTPSEAIIKKIQLKNIMLLPLSGQNTHEKLLFLVDYLAQKNIMSLIIEGGKTLLELFFDNYLVNEIQCYIANKKTDTNPLIDFINLEHYHMQEVKQIASDTFIRASKELSHV